MPALQRTEHAAGSYADFERDALARGFDSVLVREWAPALEIAEHTHPFGLRVWVVRGEVWLTDGSEVHHLCAGQGFTLPPGAPHAERYGSEGATFWVARRHAAGVAG
jgi:quercetin dioxygenase-like cupin family protein